MAYNVLQLIIGAYNAANINPEGYKTLSPEQSSKGLFLLNVILSDKQFDTSMLLYWSKLDGEFEAGVGEYLIDRLIQIETLTFFIGDDGAVRYPTQCQTLDEFMGSGRAMSIDSLPFLYYVNKVNGGANLYVYPQPNEAYPYQIWGQFELESVTLFEDLEEKFPMAYINFLRFQLAKDLCTEGGFSVPANVIEKLDTYRKTIMLNGRVDSLKMNITNTIGRLNNLNLAQINIGKGVFPGGSWL